MLPDAESARRTRTLTSARVRAVLRCRHECDGRSSVASFGARAGPLDRRLGRGRRHLQHRLPSAILYALQSGQAAPVLALIAAPGTTPRGRVSNDRLDPYIGQLAVKGPGSSRVGGDVEECLKVAVLQLIAERNRAEGPVSVLTLKTPAANPVIHQ